MRMLLRGTAPRWLTPALVALAAVLTLALTAGPIRLGGASPGAAFTYYLVRPLTTSYTVLEVLLASTPLIFTGLAALVAFRSGYYNIGGEGQFIAGAIAVTAVTVGWCAALLPFATLDGAVVLPYVNVARHARLKNVVIDRGVRIPEGLVVGEDPIEDAKWFRVSDGGITLITQEMLNRREASS